MERLGIRMLGGFEVMVDGAVVPEDAWRPRRGADLVKLLALSERHRLHRDRVVEALWSRLTPKAGLANLHKAAHLARRALGDGDAVVLHAGQVLLAPAVTVETDVERFEAAAEPELYGGELLPDDRYEEWTSEPRRRLRARYLELLRASGRLEELVREEPADEAAQCALAEALAARGRRDAALEQLRHLRDALGDLGLSPSAEAMALAKRLSQGDPVVAPVSASRPLAGRGRELDAVRSLIADRVLAGRGGALLVSGEPGIGKTRFCEEVLVMASDAGLTTLRGAAHAPEPTVPYAPVTDALDGLLTERPDLTAGLTEGARTELARQSVAAPVPGSEPTVAPDRQRIFSAVSQLLAVAAGERGAVILLDDLHAADGATVQLAHFLARTAAFQPLVVALAFDDRAVPGALASVRTSLLERRIATALALEPLGRAEADALIAAVCGAPPPPAVGEAIWRLASGSPFYTEELASAIGPDGRLRVPGRLYEILNACTARIEPSLRRALLRLAVAAEQFTADEACRLTGLDEQDALRMLDEGLGLGLLRESGRSRAIAVGPAERAVELARRQADAARSLAVAEGLDELIVEVTALRAAVAHAAGDWPGRVRYELADTLARPVMAQTVFDALHCTAEYVLADGGPYGPLTAATHELRDTAARSGARRAEAFAATVLGEAKLLAGDLGGADADLRQAVELNERVGTVCGQAVANCRLGQVWVATGRTADAREALDAAVAHARWSPLANHLLYLVYEALLRTASGAEEGIALLEREQAGLERHRACPFCAAGFQAAAAIVCAEAGDTGRASGFLEAAQASVAFWGGGPHAAAAGEAAAALALAEGATAVAVDRLREAADGFAAAAQPLNEARVRARLAAVA